MLTWDEPQARSTQRQSTLKWLATTSIALIIGFSIDLFIQNHQTSAQTRSLKSNVADNASPTNSGLTSNITDYIPTTPGKTWTYTITIGKELPISYERIYWISDNTEVTLDRRRLLIPETATKNPSEGERFTLKLPVRGPSTTCGTTGRPGFEVEILQDGLGIFADPDYTTTNSAPNALRSIFLMPSSAQEVMLSIAYHSKNPDDMPHTLAPQLHDGCSARPFLFLGTPMQELSLSGDPSNHLIFVDSSKLQNDTGHEIIHFQRVVDAEKQPPKQGIAQDSSYLFYGKFEEDTWFEKNVGLIELI